MKNFFKITATIIILSLSSTNVFAKSDLKIGAILPLSGEHELIGRNIYHSILITIFELKNLDIKIIPLDTQSTEVGAKKALSDGIEKKVDVFIGPIFIKTIKQIKDEPGFKDKIFISYSNHEEETYANVVNFGVNLSSQINALKSQFEDENDFVFFGDQSEFTKKVYQKTKSFKSDSYDPIFYKNFKDIDLKVKEITNFEERNKKHLEEIEKLENIEDNLDDEAIEKLKKHDTSEPVEFKKAFISSFDNELIASISYFDFYDANFNDVQFVSLNLWFDRKFLIEPSLENLIFPSIDYEGYRELNKKYKKDFGRDIYHLEVLSFDIIPLLAATWFSLDKEEFKVSLLNGSYKGKTGNFTINQNKVDRELNLYRIKNKKFKKI
jgi:hypothetical protein